MYKVHSPDSHKFNSCIREGVERVGWGESEIESARVCVCASIHAFMQEVTSS